MLFRYLQGNLHKFLSNPLRVGQEGGSRTPHVTGFVDHCPSCLVRLCLISSLKSADSAYRLIVGGNAPAARDTHASRWHSKHPSSKSGAVESISLNEGNSQKMPGVNRRIFSEFYSHKKVVGTKRKAKTYTVQSDTNFRDGQADWKYIWRPLIKRASIPLGWFSVIVCFRLFQLIK